GITLASSPYPRRHGQRQVFPGWRTQGTVCRVLRLKGLRDDWVWLRPPPGALSVTRRKCCPHVISCRPGGVSADVEQKGELFRASLVFSNEVNGQRGRHPGHRSGSVGREALAVADDSRADRALGLSPAEWLLLLVLAGVQFTHSMDFMVLVPLG